MKVLHILTHYAPDGSYGGPATVALTLARELKDLGHDVHLASTWPESTAVPHQINGVSALLFPVSIGRFGFARLRSKPMRRWLKANAASYDVIHVHGGRDLVAISALRASRRAGVPVVLQTHGMIQPDRRLRAAVFDRLFTRPVLSKSVLVLALHAQEREALVAVGFPANRLTILPNGVRASSQTASFGDGTKEVLFLSRLHPRKRPDSFVDMADMLIKAGGDVSAALIGPDGGCAESVLIRIEALGLTGQVTWEGAVPTADATERMSRAQVFVLPSDNEPFPMALLEALSVGLPIVTTDTCGLAARLSQADAAFITDGTPAQMAEAVHTFLASAEAWTAASGRAREAAATIFSSRKVAVQLADIYQELCPATTRV